MNRNKKLGKKWMAGVAVGMAGMMGTMPVYAAEGSAPVSKEETVYVNADATGKENQITVSDWLKNAGTEAVVKDQSVLEGIKNVKGEETFEHADDNVTWQTDGKDIYYQGTSQKELPVLLCYHSRFLFSVFRFYLLNFPAGFLPRPENR